MIIKRLVFMIDLTRLSKAGNDRVISWVFKWKEGVLLYLFFISSKHLSTNDGEGTIDKIFFFLHNTTKSWLVCFLSLVEQLFYWFG